MSAHTRKITVGLPVALLALLLIAACSAHPAKSNKPAVPTYMIYSPNAEPLNGGPLGKLTCQQALAGWFTRVSGASPTIRKDVFMADAETQFYRMDIDKNGYLVSEELDRYRAPYRQETVSAKPDADSDKDSDSDAGKGKHKKKGGSSSGDHSNAAAHLFDPVMSADANLDFQVTLAEFMKQAGDNFTKLDSNNDNALSRDEVLANCQSEEDKKKSSE